MPEMWEQEGLSCAWSCLRGDIQEELNVLGYRPSALNTRLTEERFGTGGMKSAVGT